jgi:hypothetical protein
MNKTIQLHDLGTKDIQGNWNIKKNFKEGIVLKNSKSEKILNYQLQIFF